MPQNHSLHLEKFILAGYGLHMRESTQIVNDYGGEDPCLFSKHALMVLLLSDVLLFLDIGVDNHSYGFSKNN